MSCEIFQHVEDHTYPVNSNICFAILYKVGKIIFIKNSLYFFVTVHCFLNKILICLPTQIWKQLLICCWWWGFYMLWYLSWELWIHQVSQLDFLLELFFLCEFHFFEVLYHRFFSYVNFWSCVTCDFGMKKIVFSENLLPKFCASLPYLLKKDCWQTISAYPLTKCLWSCTSLVPGWMTAFICSF